jgi:hypothetical protein
MEKNQPTVGGQGNRTRGRATRKKLFIGTAREILAKRTERLARESDVIMAKGEKENGKRRYLGQEDSALARNCKLPASQPASRMEIIR